jgi:membrane protein implicated in regulation of membrane protease activity
VPALTTGIIWPGLLVGFNMLAAIHMLAASAILSITLNDVYIFTGVVGAGYVVIAFLLGQFGGAGEGHDLGGADHDIGGGGHEIAAPADHGDLGGGHEVPGHAHADHVVGPRVFGPLSPLIVAIFLCCFGLFGWGSLQPPLSLGRLSLAPALGLSLLVAWLLIWTFNRIFARAERTSAPSAYEIIGLEAEVITPVPSGGLGEVAYTVRGARYSGPARSVSGQGLPRGQRVIIRRREGAVLYVAPVEQDDSDDRR